MNTETFDCIVLGVGGVGSATLYELARRGARVLGLDRFEPGHDRGSSHGETRIIRLSYFEHPNYVPLLLRSFAGWEALQARVGRRLYTETGLLQVGPGEGQVLRGVLASAKAHGLRVDLLSPTEVQDRFPAFGMPDGLAAIFDPRAGVLAVEDCVRTYAEEAVKLGAQLVVGEEIRGYTGKKDTIEVHTDRATYRAKRLAIAPGAWAAELLSDLGIPFEIRRKPLFWYATSDPRLAIDRGCPTWLYELPHAVIYGFPAALPYGLKLAEHSGGQRAADPRLLDRSLVPYEAARIEAFLASWLPSVTGPRTRHAVCMYTMTKDEHFVLGLHPSDQRVVVCAGLSGHGFKFCPSLSEAMADFVERQETTLPVGFLSPLRFASPQKQ